MMQLIGMLDSPYVRRVAISLKFLGIPFDHKPISVFSGYAEFERINPTVKAPTLVTDNGVVLMDSNVILEYFASRYPRGLGRVGQSTADRLADLRQIGLALVACEKTVQLVYETKLRPREKQYDVWVDRVRRQLLAAYGELEHEMGKRPTDSTLPISQVFITTAVSWRFTSHVLPDLLHQDHFPRLAKHSTAAETLWEFRSTPLE